MRNRWRHIVVCVVIAAIVIAVGLHAPIPQDPRYHSFADTRALFGIPNFWNVMSNVPFAFVGALGMAWLFRVFAEPIYQTLRWHYLGLFNGTMLVAFGSAYYHLAPDNHRLVWDRLPMTIGFISLLCSTLSERIDERLGRRVLLPLLLLGLCSVYYWDYTETQGRGDLRLYVLVQFLPLALVPLLLALYPPKFTRGHDVIIGVVFYGVAKLFEIFDAQIFKLGNIISGHSLKHFAAALAIYWLVRMLQKRQPVDVQAT
jgi:hypothetical protein